MRTIVTGARPDGTSYVASVDDIVPAGIVTPVWKTSPDDPGVSDVRGTADVLDLGVAPGATSWLVVTYEPGFESAFHRTHTIDTDLILEGSVTLVLGDGEVDLVAGDMVIVNAVDHAWRTAGEGCRKAVHLLGIDPR